MNIINFLQFKLLISRAYLQFQFKIYSLKSKWVLNWNFQYIFLIFQFQFGTKKYTLVAGFDFKTSKNRLLIIRCKWISQVRCKVTKACRLNSGSYNKCNNIYYYLYILLQNNLKFDFFLWFCGVEAIMSYSKIHFKFQLKFEKLQHFSLQFERTFDPTQLYKLIKAYSYLF